MNWPEVEIWGQKPLVSWWDKMRKDALKKDEPKLYILVRKDLPKSYRMVQGMHAVATYCLANGLKDWKNGTMICLLANDEGHLKHIWEYLVKTVGMVASSWKEPDLNDEITAVAFVLEKSDALQELALA